MEKDRTVEEMIELCNSCVVSKFAHDLSDSAIDIWGSEKVWLSDFKKRENIGLEKVVYVDFLNTVFLFGKSIL